MGQFTALLRSERLENERKIFVYRRFARLVASSERVPVRFYLTIGLLERGRLFYVDLVSMIHSNRHVRDVLQAKGYTLFYHEVPAAHDPYNWEATLPQALITLLTR